LAVRTAWSPLHMRLPKGERQIRKTATLVQRLRRMGRRESGTSVIFL
jgi:hypothetical protein